MLDIFWRFLLSFVHRPQPDGLPALGWIDLLSSIPTVQGLRILRLFRVLRVVHLLRNRRQISQVLRNASQHAAQSTLLMLITLFVPLVMAAAWLILQVEAQHGGNITEVEDALWWVLVTITTVGYGDFYPVTITGRVLSMVLMVVGIGVFGALAAMIAGWFVREQQADEDVTLQDLAQQIAALQASVEDLRQQA